jgi:RecB family endonuclease NucS
MTAIWQNDGTSWCLLAPTGFPDEQTLHDLVEETPQILPLAGAPRLVIVGKEVSLGNGYADLVAIEPSGRLAVVEIKLSKNAEARRAVVAQILTYAAHLKGLSSETVERDVLGRHQRVRLQKVVNP